MQIGIIVLLIMRFARGQFFDAVRQLISRNTLVLAFLLSLAGMLGSLAYSELFHLPACEFCWFQRIFIYATVFVLGTALYIRDIRGIIYARVLMTMALILGLYQYLMQFGLAPETACDANGGVSCSAIDILMFGYITIPLMSMTVSGLVLVLLWYGSTSDKK